MPYRRRAARRKGESLKSLAVKIDKLQHPRSQWAKAWVPKKYVAAPAGGPGAGMVREYGPNHVVGSGMYTGKGGFWGDMWRGTAGARSALGNWARTQGGVVGGLGQISGALGIGDYTTNSIVNGGMGAPEAVPSFSDNTGSSVVISHREYLSDVYGTPAGQNFQNSSYSLNPGLESTFPWLAQIAQNYEEYTIRQLIFTFRSSIAPIGSSGTGQVGTVIMATQYNAGEEPFSDKETMMQYDGAMSAKVIDGLISGVECDPAQNAGSYGKYIRAGPAPIGQDIKTYDLGQFNMAVTNIPSSYENQSLGELWVSYTIELRKPRFFTARGLGIQRDSFVGPRGSTYSVVDQFGPAVVTDGVVTLGAQQPRLLYAQQNNIKTVPFVQYVAVPDPLYNNPGFLFPAGFSGSVTVTYTAYSYDAMPTTAALGVVCNGNIEPISDQYAVNAPNTRSLWGALTSQSGTAFTSTQDSPTVGLPVNVIQITGHFRVQIATGGQDNYIVLSIRGSTAWPALTGLSVDVTEYNTGFNYRQDGTNDQLVLVNSGGQVVVPT